MGVGKTKLSKLAAENALSGAAIRGRRRAIRQTLFRHSVNIGDGDFETISAADLRILMQEYDQLFLQRLCRRVLNESGDQLNFRVSTRMTSTGGKTTVDASRGDEPRQFEIVVSATLLFESFSKGQPDICVAGLPCVDRLDALQRIFEHELIHLIEFLAWDESSCAANRFRSIAWRFFGHRQSNHQLITPSESAEMKKGISIGDFVSFRHDGRQKFGYVNHINRRATILVPDNQGAKYTDGKRYAKFYVPVSALRKPK